MSDMDEPIVCSLRTIYTIFAIALIIGATIGLFIGVVLT